MTRARLLVVAITIASALGTRATEAHQQSATFGDVGQGNEAGEIVWRLRVPESNLVAALGFTAPAQPPPPSDEPGMRALALAYLSAGLHVNADGRPCPAAGTAWGPAPADVEPTWQLVQRFRCQPDSQEIGLRYELFFESDPFHESFTRLELGEPGDRSSAGTSTATVVFRTGLRQIAVSRGEERSVWRNSVAYLRLGIFHILTGYDHLSFLLALLLGATLSRRTTGPRPGPGRLAAPASPRTEAAAASVRQALGGAVSVISAFTVAHSLTLIAQVLRPGSVPTRWVEPAIAFSVAYVGFENLIPRAPHHRWLLVFGFGLVHGLGFASVLREIGLPRRGLVLCLLSFNLGVEMGQLMVLALTFPILLAAARRAPRRFERWGLQLGSAIIAGFGTVWLIARLWAAAR